MTFRDVACVFVYIDDILIFSKDEQSHIHDLRQVLPYLFAYKMGRAPTSPGRLSVFCLDPFIRRRKESR